MSPSDDGLLRDVTREVLAELLPGLLEQALAGPATARRGANGHHPEPPAVAGGDPGAVPVVPAPPVAAVHRPPGWAQAAAEPGAGQPAAGSPPEPRSVPAGGRVEQVDLRTDAGLDGFVRSLLHRFENPRDREAIRSGKLRFALRAGAAAPAVAAGPVIRVERGAVTERAVRDAAAAGARLVLAPAAVLTPMARDRARSLGIQIEKERRC